VIDVFLGDTGTNNVKFAISTQNVIHNVDVYLTDGLGVVYWHLRIISSFSKTDNSVHHIARICCGVKAEEVQRLKKTRRSGHRGIGAGKSHDPWTAISEILPPFAAPVVHGH
jgi:hypothetical protein